MTITQAHHAEYQAARSRFIAWLANEHMFNTLAMLQQCTFDLTDNDSHVASIMMSPRAAPKITINLKLLDNQDYFKYAMLHELRHLPQFARFGSDEFLASVPWPDFVDTPVKRKVVYRLYSNIAMDMALNEDLRRMLGEQKFQESVHGAVEAVIGKAGKPCIVSDPTWQRDQDFVYYMLKLIEEQDGKDGGAEAGPQDYQQMDDHQGPGEGQEGEEGDATRGNLRDLLQRAEQEAKTLSNSRGYQSADQDLTLKGNDVNEEVRAFIRAMRVKINRLFEGKSQRRYAFENFNRLWPKRGLPGHKSHTEKIPGIVVVLDTSGSVVYDESVFNQLRGATLELERTQKVRAVYCCDVKLVRMNNTTTAHGGGGTMLEPEHMVQIRKDLGLKDAEMLSVIYITDGDVSLDNLRKDKTVDIHELILQRGRR